MSQPIPKCQAPGCHRDCWLDPSTNTYSLACGRTHLDEIRRRTTQAATRAIPTCQVPRCHRACWLDPSTNTYSVACGRIHLNAIRGLSTQIAHIAQPATSTSSVTPLAASPGVSDWSERTLPNAARFYKTGSHHSSTGADPTKAFMGNFFKTDIVLPGGYSSKFLCSEAMYQAAKYLNPALPLSDPNNLSILDLFSSEAKRTIFTGPEEDWCGEQAFQTGRNRPKSSERSDWKRINLQVMRNILLLKFAQNRNLVNALLATGNTILIERTDRDSFWGDGTDRKGENQLGRLLMDIRDEAKQFGGNLGMPASAEEVFCFPVPVTAPNATQPSLGAAPATAVMRTRENTGALSPFSVFVGAFALIMGLFYFLQSRFRA